MNNVIVVFIATLIFAIPASAEQFIKFGGYRDAGLVENTIPACGNGKLSARGITSGDSFEVWDLEAGATDTVGGILIATFDDTYSGSRVDYVSSNGRLVVNVPTAGRFESNMALINHDCEFNSSRSITEVDSGALPNGSTGANYKLDTDTSLFGEQENTISGVMLSPGSTAQPSTMCSNVLPVLLHEDLAALYADDAALQAAAPISPTIGCTYSSNIGGYDQHVNNSASTMINSMHAFIGAGLAIDHITMIGAHSSFTVGDCMNSSIIGATRSQMQCQYVSGGQSSRNTITGGADHVMDFSNVTTPSDASDNSIVGGFGNVITGPSSKGLISGGYKNAIIIDTSLGPVYGTKVSGHGSKVFSADIGDGTHMAPHFAEAHGHAAVSWLPGMKCEAYGWEGDTVTHLSVDGEGTAFNEAQRCKLGMTNSRILVGTTDSLWLDRDVNTVPFVNGPGLWHIAGELTCATWEVSLSSGANPSATAVFDVDHSIFFESVAGEAHVLANDGTTLNQSQSLTQTTEYTEGGQRNDVTASIVARDGTASLNAGFNFDVTNTAGTEVSSNIQCFADLEITMHRENQ